MAKPVIFAVDDDPLFLFPVNRPATAGTSTSLEVERSHSGRGIRLAARLSVEG